MKSAYKQLLERYQEMQLFGSISGVLYWDMNTYMPPAAVEHRAKQFKYISQKLHKMWIDSSFADLLVQSEKIDSLDSLQTRNVELIRRSYDSRTILPSELVGQMAAQSNKTLEIWKKAKAKKEFQMVLSDMEKLFALNVQAAELYAKSKNMHDSFDALIDQRDKGFSVEKLTKLFDEVKAF